MGAMEQPTSTELCCSVRRAQNHRGNKKMKLCINEFKVKLSSELTGKEGGNGIINMASSWDCNIGTGKNKKKLHSGVNLQPTIGQ